MRLFFKLTTARFAGTPLHEWRGDNDLIIYVHNNKYVMDLYVQPMPHAHIFFTLHAFSVLVASVTF